MKAIWRMPTRFLSSCGRQIVVPYDFRDHQALFVSQQLLVQNCQQLSAGHPLLAIHPQGKPRGILVKENKGESATLRTI